MVIHFKYSILMCSLINIQFAEDYLGFDLFGLVATVMCGVWVTWAPW